jgi:hypothetical protein
MPPKLALPTCGKSPARSGLCCSDRYLGNQVKLRWQCAAGFSWETPPFTIKRRSWHPE